MSFCRAILGRSHCPEEWGGQCDRCESWRRYERIERRWMRIAALVLWAFAIATIVAVFMCSRARGADMTCRLESEERLSSTTKACRYSCAAGVDYVITVKGFCPRYVRYNQ